MIFTSDSVRRLLWAYLFHSKDKDEFTVYKQWENMYSTLKVHKIDNFFDSDFGICVISLLFMSKY